MKATILSFLLPFVFSVGLFGQTQVPAMRLCISENKTTHLIYPYPVKSADHGNRSVAVTTGKNGVTNILSVKATDSGFVQTNLTVVTADGKLYSYLLCYSKDPDALTYSYLPVPTAQFTGDLPNERILDSTAQALYARPARRLAKSHRSKCSGTLSGAWYEKDLLWLRWKVDNHYPSVIPPVKIRLFVVNKGQTKRTAYQELVLDPLFSSDSLGVDRHEQITLQAFRSVHLSSRHLLVAHLVDRSGTELLTIRVKGKKIN